MGNTESLQEHLESFVGSIVLSIDLDEEENQFTVAFEDGMTICIGLDERERFYLRSFKRNPESMH